MQTLLDYSAIFGISLLSSVHCAGMCGGFALAIGRGAEGRYDLAIRQTVYSAGRVTTYLMLGALAGFVGFAATNHSLFRGTAFMLSLIAGLSMIGLGLHQFGATKYFGWHTKLAPPEFLRAMMSRILELKDPIVPFALGLLTGLLPCGLVFSWLLQAAATRSPFEGLTTMAFFGLGTIPMMFAMGYSPGFLRPSWRLKLNYIAAGGLIGFGAFQIYRGSMILSGSASCCHPG